MKYKCKLTVLRREYYTDLAYAELEEPSVGKCDIFSDGQEFWVDEDSFESFPAHSGFCQSAWDIVKPFVRRALDGKDPYRTGWSRDPSRLVLCCNDGIRPVIFLLERIDVANG